MLYSIKFILKSNRLYYDYNDKCISVHRVLNYISFILSVFCEGEYVSTRTTIIKQQIKPNNKIINISPFLNN